jgi:hypothetical protein
MGNREAEVSKPIDDSLAAEPDELEATLRALVITRPKKPARMIPATFRLVPHIKAMIFAAAKKHGIEQSEIVRLALGARARQMLVIAVIDDVSNHPWVEPRNYGQAKRTFNVCTYRITLSIQRDLEAAAKKHGVDQIQIVRPVLEEYARELLTMRTIKYAA